MVGGGTASNLILVSVVALVLTVPFVTKPFHIDDGIYVEMAHETRNFNPLDTRGRYFYGGVEFDNLALNAHPIVIPYYLKLLIDLTGSSDEVPLHIGFLIFPILAAIACYFLADRFCSHPLIGTLLVITTPTFVLSAHSLMTDLPQMAFWLTAVALVVSGIDHGRRGRLIAGGLVAGLATLTGYQTLALIPLCLLYGLLLHGRRGLGRAAFAMGITATLFVAWSLGSYWTQGLVPIQYAGAVAEKFPEAFGSVEATLEEGVSKLLSLLSNLGGVAIFPLMVVAGFLGTPRSRWSLFAGVMFAFLFLENITPSLESPSLLEVSEYDLSARWFLWFCVACGTAIIWRTLLGSISLLVRFRQIDNHQKELLFLFAWVVGVGTYYCYILPFGAARYLLPMFVPVALILVRYFEPPFSDRPRLLRKVAGVSIAGSVVLSLAMGIGDYEQAQVYRDFAKSSWLNERMSRSPGTTRMLAELGARIYLGQQGVSYHTEAKIERGPDGSERVVATPAMNPGDQFIRTGESWSPEITPRMSQQSITVPQTFVIDSVQWPVRTYSKVSKVGFYTHTNGYLPFWFDRESPLETFWLFTVRKPWPPVPLGDGGR